MGLDDSRSTVLSSKNPEHAPWFRALYCCGKGTVDLTLSNLLMKTTSVSLPNLWNLEVSPESRHLFSLAIVLHIDSLSHFSLDTQLFY